MNILETEWWSMALPPEWWAESEEGSILVGDRDDVGCLEFTSLHKNSGEFGATEVQDIADAESEHKLSWKPLNLGDFEGVSSSFAEEGTAIREWYLANGKLLLFVTYSCDKDNAGMDDAAVNEILDTLTLVVGE